MLVADARCHEDFGRVTENDYSELGYTLGFEDGLDEIAECSHCVYGQSIPAFVDDGSYGVYGEEITINHDELLEPAFIGTWRKGDHFIRLEMSEDGLVGYCFNEDQIF